MKNKKVFILLGVFWLVIIGGFLAYKEYTLQTGQEVLLKTTPVDPRDLFRGDYVVLNYDISTLDPEEIAFERGDMESGGDIYVGLDIEGGYASAEGAYPEPPNDLFIKGTIKNTNNGRLSVEYGIESYFVPEGRGGEIERHLGGGVDVKVAIDRFGNAVIRSLLVGGEEVEF